MAISKTIIKMNHVEALVKVVNDVASAGAITIDLDVDLLKSNEELDGLAPTVNIGSLEFSTAVTGEISIVRNSVVVNNAFENTESFELAWGADNQNNTFDIVVNMSAKGTVYMRLLKVQGYRPLFRPEQGVTP